MKKFAAVALVALASAAFAEDTTSVAIHNVCDSLALGGNPVVEFIPAYIDESNWYGDIHTGTQDSLTTTRHTSYKTLQINSNKFTYELPLSVMAACVETKGTEFKFATWNNSKAWIEDSHDDYATRIFDIRSLKFDNYDSTNTYNLLAFVPEALPEDDAYKSHQLLVSKTFEFAFEWWFVGASYKHIYRGTGADSLKIFATTRFSSSISNDSLKAFEAAVNALEVPDTTKSVRIQMVKVVLADSRKPLLSSSSSAEPISSSESSSSSEEPSSSSADPVSCSAEQSSSSVSSSSKEESSSSVESSSSKEESSSSESPVSCSAEESSSSSAPSSSSEKSSSSSAEPESSAAESSSSEAESSSSEGSVRLVTAKSLEGLRVLQVRRLDGTVMDNSGKLAPGVYYMKYSNGIWKKTAVLPK